MKLAGKTILITGGTAGIGLEAAKQFLAHGAKVIITGRDQPKLDKAKKLYPDLVAIKSDVANADDSSVVRRPQDDPLELFWLREAAEDGEGHLKRLVALGRRLADLAEGDLQILLAEGGDDILHRQIAGHQLVGMILGDSADQFLHISANPPKPTRCLQTLTVHPHTHAQGRPLTSGPYSRLATPIPKRRRGLAQAPT